MQEKIAEERAFIEKSYPDSPRFALELDPRIYRKRLAAEFMAARARVSG
mgnify:CR=1 FL=1